MASEWSTVRAADFIEFNPRLSIKKGALATKVAMDKLQPFTKKIPAIEQAAFAGGSKFCNGDTIMARITPCLENGKTAFVDILADGEVAFGSTEFIVMRARAGISDPQFIYYLATSPAFRNVAIKSMVGSSGRQRVQQGVLDELELTVPPLEEQKRIGAFLAMLDQKIALNNKINDNLQQQAQALFVAWFVNFIPFGGTAPNDWPYVSFADFLTPRTEKSNDPSLPMYSVTDTGIYPRDEKFKKNLSMSNAKNKVIYNTDLVFGMSREILNWGIMRYDIGGVSSAYNVFSVSDTINSFYLESYIKHNGSYFRDLIKPASREGQGIDKNVLMQKQILLPPFDVLQSYYSIENALTQKIAYNQVENARLAELRDTLLPRLLTGEINVSNIDN